jgi:glutathione S-transferase
MRKTAKAPSRQECRNIHNETVRQRETDCAQVRDLKLAVSLPHCESFLASWRLGGFQGGEKLDTFAQRFALQAGPEPMIKLYTVDLSPYSARVRMQIYAKGIADIVFEGPGEHWGLPKFRERFPIGRIPVLDIDGDMMPESEVIAEYLEEIYLEPSLLGATPRATAHIRTLARFGDIYIINNMFMLSRLTGALGRKTPAAARDDAVTDQLAGEVVRNIRALDRLIARDGFACSSRITLADCALVPGLFFVETVLPVIGVDVPIPAAANVATYWAAIQKNEHAARVLIELRRGVEERREMIRSGEIERFRAAAAEAQKAADAQD